MLSQKTRENIQNKIWKVWFIKKSAPFGLLLLVAIFEAAFVSFKDVALNAVGSSQNLQTFATYWVSAFATAELYVLGGAAVLLVGGGYFVRNVVRDIQTMTSLKRERVSLR